MTGRRWTPEDTATLQALWPTVASREVAVRMDRSLGMLYVKASELGIRKCSRSERQSRATSAVARQEALREAERAAAARRAVDPAQVAYRKALYREAMSAFVAHGLDSPAAALAVQLIARGKVPRVTFRY